MPDGALASEQNCCNFFNEGVCVANCPEGLQPGTNFVCGEFDLHEHLVMLEIQYFSSRLNTMRCRLSKLCKSEIYINVNGYL